MGGGSGRPVNDDPREYGDLRMDSRARACEYPNMAKSVRSRTSASSRGKVSKKSGGSQKKVRYAVVGLGQISQVAVLPAFRRAANSELVALVSGDPKKQKKIGQKYGIDRIYSYEEYEGCLSEASVDAVYITLPNHLHREYAIRAANAGVHVLCEKPMAVTEEDCEAMIDAAESKGVKLMIAYRLHFEKANLEAIRLIQKGTLGEPRFFNSSFGQQVDPDNIRVTEPTEKGGGPLYDMGTYCINAARYLFRDEPVAISAFRSSNDEKRFSKTEEMVSVLLRFPNDRLASFTCSFGSASVSEYTLAGTKGTLVADPAYDYSVPLTHRLTINEKTTVRRFPKQDQFAAELIYFSDCIQKDKEPEPSGYEGLADVRVIRAIYQSARMGEVVSLPAFDKKQRPSKQQEIARPAHGMPETVNVKSPSGEAA